MTRPRCTLAHDLINQMFAISAFCDDLDARFPSLWCQEKTAKIRHIANRITNTVLSPQCTQCDTPIEHEEVKQ